MGICCGQGASEKRKTYDRVCRSSGVRGQARTRKDKRQSQWKFVDTCRMPSGLMSPTGGLWGKSDFFGGIKGRLQRGGRT